MKLIILSDYDEASEWAAKYIRNKILLFNPGPDRYFTLGLPTGKQKFEDRDFSAAPHLMKKKNPNQNRLVRLTCRTFEVPWPQFDVVSVCCVQEAPP